MAIAAIEHIDVDEKGIARIVGSRIKVKHLVIDTRVHGWSAKELHDNFPHLSMAAIHAALAYYYDHQAEIDRQIEEDDHEAEAFFAARGETPFVARLRREGKLP